jgi:hypothetical protein
MEALREVLYDLFKRYFPFHNCDIGNLFIRNKIDSLFLLMAI